MAHFPERTRHAARFGTAGRVFAVMLSLLLVSGCGKEDETPATADVEIEPAEVPAAVEVDVETSAGSSTESSVEPGAGQGARSSAGSGDGSEAESSDESSAGPGTESNARANATDGHRPLSTAGHLSGATHMAATIARMRANRAPLTPAVDEVDDAYDWQIPDWLPPPPVPADNPMSEAKVRLGRHLFHDHRLSADDTIACASCHEQSLGFTDGRPLAVGIHGTRANRNAMGLANVGYSPVLTWSNPHMSSLERQSLVPLFGEEPLEMGMGGREDALFERLAADADYAAMFAEAFPEQAGAVNLATITRALGAFQRTLISVGSAYDRYQYGGDTTALDASALRGEMLFFSERAECYHCHQGFNFTDTLQTSRSAFPEVAFHNTGLYNLDARGTYPPGQQGLREISGRDADMGRFRTPSLRNVAVTAPYFHDGSAATLDEVLDHYAAGGRTVDGPHAGVGHDNPLKDPLVRGFLLNPGMRADLTAFLNSLTDEAFLSEPRFSNPWPAGHPAHGGAATGAAAGAATGAAAGMATGTAKPASPSSSLPTIEQDPHRP